ncbi:putative transmembrane protein [Toxoplasma gondii TgCatPRC2]|uniref:Putative transmembrane protein n=1 Tax=Toxoplasma gondii TgCatPRC2 TaxID=1130821 RepID=A0A151H807_TOXGO|nr:putative transmembrane protein [Toxoplasma gondii TgCatPRC2]
MEQIRFGTVALKPHGDFLAKMPAAETRRPRHRPLLCLVAAVVSLVVLCICVEGPAGVEAGAFKDLSKETKKLKKKEKTMKKYRKKLKKPVSCSISSCMTMSRSTAETKVKKYAALLEQAMQTVREYMMRVQSKIATAEQSLQTLSPKKQSKKKKKINKAHERLQKTTAEYNKAVKLLKDAGRNVDNLSLASISGGGGNDDDDDGYDERDVRRKK